jgi:hypothetical protein
VNQIVNLLRNYLVDHSIIIIVAWISNSSKRVVITKREKESKHELKEIKKIVEAEKGQKSRSTQKKIRTKA